MGWMPRTTTDREYVGTLQCTDSSLPYTPENLNHQIQRAVF